MLYLHTLCVGSVVFLAHFAFDKRRSKRTSKKQFLFYFSICANFRKLSSCFHVDGGLSIRLWLDSMFSLSLLDPDLTMDSFSTKSLALQAQKKLMSKMATKSVASLFIDDTSSEVLDELYRVTKEYTRNRKESQKIIKNLIKMVVKLGVLYRNNQFNSEELILVENFRWRPSFIALVSTRGSLDRSPTLLLLLQSHVIVSWYVSMLGSMLADVPTTYATDEHQLYFFKGHEWGSSSVLDTDSMWRSFYHHFVLSETNLLE